MITISFWGLVLAIVSTVLITLLVVLKIQCDKLDIGDFEPSEADDEDY